MRPPLFFLFCSLLGMECLLASELPNIVLMLSDDQGWNGLSVPMHPEVAASKGEEFHTPNLEKLASEGMRFSAGYAPASVCSPTRISLQTGRSPAALHWTKAAPPEEGHRLLEPKNVKSLDASQITIAELLKQAGYATAHYGKWHIAGGGPGQHGYDEHDGDTGNENAFKFKDPNPVDIFGMATRAEAFMMQSRNAGKPFFIQLSWNALHASENASRATMEKYERQLHGENSKRISTAAITEDLDRGVGKVLESLDRLGMRQSTYVIYMADNGASGGKKVLNGGKGGVWEGGIRVPWIVRGPGIKPNSWCHERVVGYDWFPTFCEWGKVPLSSLPSGLEGGSLVSLLKNPVHATVKRSREELVFHFPHYQGDTPHSAIFLGNLKLLHFYEDDRDLLFDLNQDLSERNDLAATRPADVQRLRERLQTYLTSVNAQLPTPNPHFDPNNPAPMRPSKGNPNKNNPNKGNPSKGKGMKGNNLK